MKTSMVPNAFSHPLGLFLGEVGMLELEEAFQAARIDKDALLLMDRDAFISMKLSIGDCLKLSHALKKHTSGDLDRGQYRRLSLHQRLFTASVTTLCVV